MPKEVFYLGIAVIVGTVAIYAIHEKASVTMGYNGGWLKVN